jgi:methyl-accepting chemotaxis protein
MNLITIVSFILLTILAITSYYKLSELTDGYHHTSTISELAVDITKTSEQGLQIVNALRGVALNPNDSKAKDNFLKAVEEFDGLIKGLSSIPKHISLGYSKFEIEPLYIAMQTDLNEVVKVVKNSQDITKEHNSNVTAKWRPLKAKLIEWEKANTEKTANLKASFDSTLSLTNTVIISLVIAVLVIMIAIVQIISSNIVDSVKQLHSGINEFFSFLRREKENVKSITLNSTDEFGQMATEINNGISLAIKEIDLDKELIKDAQTVMTRVKNGWYSQFIEKSTTNKFLEEFKNDVNVMIDSTRKRFLEVDEVLEEYSHHNYMRKLPLSATDERGGLLERLVNGINSLQNSVTLMLVENKSNGLTLDESSNILLENVDKLNHSSNEAAASLEETAAALEQITSNIRNNTENIAKMATLANGVTSSANKGEKLANQTTVAMEEINTQVSAINEAIAVIDQIAFQTNILSLNAAVEAATAGEAGKGFAVVAGEVRNLAARSAEAAKEIKDIVERATSKANEGKAIANDMIHGYTELNTNISQTLNLISDIEMASKEQLQGIEQINDAVTMLDQQTQQNAMVASQTHDVAVLTDEIAKLVVSNANAKQFVGKDSVRAKEFKRPEHHINVPAKTPIKKPTKSTVSKPTQASVTKITPNAKSSNDEWEAF